MEVAPGIHRIESDLGPRMMAQYLLRGDDLTVLVDTGLRDTPDRAIAPYLRGLGLAPADVDLVLVSHADVDHCGGNRRFLELAPQARVLVHADDRDWVASNDAMMRGNYLWYRDYGFGPDEESVAWISEHLGGDAPVHGTVRDGEVMRLGAQRQVEVLHLPGHTPGHVGLWEPDGRVAVIVDAALERGVYDRDGTLLIPPRIYDVQAYRSTLRRLLDLRPRLLLTAHYPVFEGPAALAFLERSLAHADAVENVVREVVGAGEEDLWAVTRAVDARLGPYPEFTIELAAAVRWHLEHTAAAR